MTRIRALIRHFAIRASRPLDRLVDYDDVVIVDRRQQGRRREDRRELVRV